MDYLLETIVRVDPTDGCVMMGDVAEWGRLAPEKSLFHSPPAGAFPATACGSRCFEPNEPQIIGCAQCVVS